MAKPKHLLEIERGIRVLAPTAQVTYCPGRKHRVLQVRIGNVLKKFSVASSPSVAEHAVVNTLKAITKSFQLEAPC